MADTVQPWAQLSFPQRSPVSPTPNLFQTPAQTHLVWFPPHDPDPPLLPERKIHYSTTTPHHIPEIPNIHTTPFYSPAAFAQQIQNTPHPHVSSPHTKPHHYSHPLAPTPHILPSQPCPRHTFPHIQHSIIPHLRHSQYNVHQATFVITTPLESDCNTQLPVTRTTPTHLYCATPLTEVISSTTTPTTYPTNPKAPLPTPPTPSPPPRPARLTRLRGNNPPRTRKKKEICPSL